MPTVLCAASCPHPPPTSTGEAQSVLILYIHMFVHWRGGGGLVEGDLLTVRTYMLVMHLQSILKRP